MPVCKQGCLEQPVQRSCLGQCVSVGHSLCPVSCPTLPTSVSTEMIHSNCCSWYPCHKFPDFIQQIPHCRPVGELALVLYWNLPTHSLRLWSWACVTLRSRNRQPDWIPAELPLFSFPFAAGERHIGKFGFPFGVNMPLLTCYSLWVPGEGGLLL